ncbi:MAG: MlaD family protein, partial [Enterobacteriaceae bacterium]
METRAHYVIVGLFTVIVTAAALLFSLWLNSQGNDGSFKVYNVLFNEAVNGLSEGSGVQYSGIRVGEVTQLRLDNDDPSKVWARIRIRVNTPIRENTRARLMITSITGSAAIQLSSASANSPELTTKGDEIPTIRAVPSPFNELLNNGQDLVAGVDEILSHAKMMLSTENIDNLSSSLQNLQQATAALAKE